jgi:hypothetical protein
MLVVKKLMEEYTALTHQEKYDKLLVYLYAAQKSEENLISLCMLLTDLGVDNIDDASMIELYDAFVTLVEYNDDTKVSKANKIISKLELIREQELQSSRQDEEEVDSLLQSL